MTQTPGQASQTPAPVAPIYFCSLELEGLSGFQEGQVLNLATATGEPARWTFILGNNGVGKTTLLRCLAGMGSTPGTQAGQAGGVPMWSRLGDWLQPYPEAGGNFWRNGTGRLQAQLAAGVRLSAATPVAPNAEPSSPRLENYRVEVNLGGDWSGYGDPLSGFQCYGYGAVRPLPAGESQMEFPSASLFADTPLLSVESWLLQTDAAARTATGARRDRLHTHLHHLLDLLKRLPSSVDTVQIQAEAGAARPQVRFHTPNGWLPLAHLGLGYRSLAAWVGDLAIRLLHRYPDSSQPWAEPAIALVEEPDLHLHPLWQRRLVGFLTEQFPQTQFIATTHSPVMVQTAGDANLVVLKREGDRVFIHNHPEVVENGRIDQVLTSVFELPTSRPLDLEPLLRRRQMLLSQAKLSAADQSELRQLEAQIGALPTADHPDDRKAMDIIRRAAQLLDNS